ncbi:PAS domain-containing sensor histidine kinase [Pedobacter sp. GR22-6]|uniref:PAS domain-containing sensor histidine kinase n=1 Tax=Pedobacter sp. GR22-6 TaxID=3127957 RepID=UPI00307DA9F7
MNVPDPHILAGLIEGSPYPVYLIVGEKLRVALANAACLRAWGKDKSVIGMPFSQALPELAGQPFEALLKRVLATGEPYYAINDKAELIIDGKLTTSYYTFSYQPVKDATGRNTGVVCYATDVTELVNSIADVQRLNEQEFAANELLAEINAKLIATNDDLENVNKELHSSYDQLESSEQRFRNLIQQAPFAICVIRASDLIVTDVNDRYLELVGKNRAQLDGKRIWDGVPEAAKVYAPVMQQVISTHIPYTAKEAQVPLLRHGILEHLFIDFVYEPVLSLEGIVTAIMVIGIDVSEKVNARKSIEEIEERMRLATQAANIGIFEFRYEAETLTTSERFDEIFGLQNADRKTLLSLYHPEDLHLSDRAHQEASITGNIFYEARIFPPQGEMKWVRFQARVFFDAAGVPERVIGTVVDITEYKTLQQQKDDFISIASHELKTPITTLKASLQMLDRMKHNINPVLFPKLIEQSTRSISKITDLVDDLLNVSKMSQGEVPLQKEWFRVATLLDNCCSHIRESGNHELILTGDQELKVFADEHRIDQVVVNLVNNSVKYAPLSREIYLHIEKQDDFIKISVRDQGPGIPSAKIPYLFDRYFRADDSGNQVSGLGLGLYICADIIARHGGEIGVDTELGMGSTFWFTLPA